MGSLANWLMQLWQLEVVLLIGNQENQRTK